MDVAHLICRAIVERYLKHRLDIDKENPNRF